MQPIQIPAWLSLFSTLASAQLIDRLSFGHSSLLSPNSQDLRGWSLSGENHSPQLLSDRVILTPPVPGNTRGALWTDSTLDTETWTADLTFRASGQEGATGNLNLWLTSDKSQIGANSVYTVGQFDGLVLVLDQYGGTGGKLRGFLNDGSANFRALSSLESLAFGHCDFRYRNLGAPSTITVTHQNALSVSVDGRECFRTERVALPKGYYFGITATTGEEPDSFEVNSFKVSYADGNTPPAAAVPPQQQQQQQQQGQAPTLQKLDRFPGAPEAVPDAVAEEFQGSEQQFADLHNRLQGMTHQVANIFGEFDALSNKLEQRFQDVIGAIPAAAAGAGGGDAAVQLGRDVRELRGKIEGIERTVQRIQKDVEGRDYGKHLGELQSSIGDLKGGLTEHLPDTLSRIVSSSAPRMGLFLGVVIAVQILLALAYVVYKRRRNGMPKKYL